MLVGREGFEPSKDNAGRFTVCSLWPLGHRPIMLRPVPSGSGPCEALRAYRSPVRTPRPVPVARGVGVTLAGMPSFDVVSEVDAQEVRNAVDQAQREIGTRFDFKNTNSTIEQNEMVITLRTVSEDRLTALRTVLEEKLVKRGVSLKGVEYGDVQEATQNTVRQVVTIKVGISSDKAREINKLIKEKAEKGISSQTQGESIRVTGKKRDSLQGVIAMLKAEDVGIPLQFQNFRD